MEKNKLTLLDELRQERDIVKRECNESETRLSEHWEYFSDNAPTLIIDSAVTGITRWMGFGHKEKKRKETDFEETESTGIVQSIFGNLSAFYPLIWDMVKPMLWQYSVNKVKSFFTGGKKKKQRYDDED